MKGKKVGQAGRLLSGPSRDRGGGAVPRKKKYWEIPYVASERQLNRRRRDLPPMRANLHSDRSPGAHFRRDLHNFRKLGRWRSDPTNKIHWLRRDRRNINRLGELDIPIYTRSHCGKRRENLYGYIHLRSGIREGNYLRREALDSSKARVFAAGPSEPEGSSRPIARFISELCCENSAASTPEARIA